MSIRDRGFASMSRERQHELASKGGRAVHAKGAATNGRSKRRARPVGKGCLRSHANGHESERESLNCRPNHRTLVSDLLSIRQWHRILRTVCCAAVNR
jgi:uncharacterized protein